MPTSKRLVFEVELPTHIEVGVKKIKKYPINLNNFRNWQHYLKNTIKQKYKEVLKDKVPLINIKDTIAIHYYFYPAGKRRKDLMNVIALQDKFFSDVLVELGIIPDDDYTIVKEVKAKTMEHREKETIIAKVFINV